ncbi:MAG: tetratricopeptide repeat protein [Cyclobacteriaceae bacterium]
MKTVATTLFLLIATITLGQTIQERITEADTTKSDSLRVLQYARISMEYRRSNPDSGFYFARKALRLANKINVKSVQASSHNAIGNLFFFQSDYDSALYHYGRCYDLSVSINDSIRIASMLNNIGQVNNYLANYDTAIFLLLQAREAYTRVDSTRIANAVNNLGNTYYKMNDFDRALEYYLEAAELKEKFGQKLSLSNTLNNIGIILKNQGKYEEAIPYYEKSLEIAEEYNDKNKQANAHNNLSSLYQDGPGDLKKSEYHVLKSIALKQEMGDKAGLYNSYNNYADLLSETRRFTEALSYIERAEALEKELGTTMYTADGLLMKSYVLRDLGRYKEAYETYRQAYVTKVDQVNEDRNKKISEWEVKFETAQKEAEIEKLELEGKLKDANLARSRNAQIGIAGGAGLLIVFIVVFYKIRQKKQQAENEAQELQIEALQKRLTDLNINHAEMKLDLNGLNAILHNPLTEREFDSLRLSLDGKTNAEIADNLFISVSTVKFHLRNTYGKLGVSNRKEAMVYISQSS